MTSLVTDYSIQKMRLNLNGNSEISENWSAGFFSYSTVVADFHMFLEFHQFIMFELVLFSTVCKYFEGTHLLATVGGKSLALLCLNDIWRSKPARSQKLLRGGTFDSPCETRDLC
jgi:hypothetical protein